MSIEKNLFPKHRKSINVIFKFICKLLDHRWSYKNYEMTLKEDGSKYDYKYSRRCHRCNKRQVFKTDEVGWEDSYEYKEATF